MGHSQKEKKWVLLLQSNRDMWQSLNKIIEKKRERNEENGKVKERKMEKGKTN